MQATAIPSGDQVTLHHGDWTATVTEVGATLRVLQHAGADVIEPFDEQEMAWAAHGQALLPWPNRIDGGRYRAGGRELQLPITEPAHNNAIHGLTRFANWVVAERDTSGCRLTLRLHAQPGYPWVLDLAIAYALDGGGLTVDTVAVNRSDTPCPFGAGYHPYLAAGDPRIDSSELQLPAATVLKADERGIPTGDRQAVQGTAYDFRSARRIGDAVLDTCYTDLISEDSRVTVVLRGADREVRLWLEPPHTHLMVFTGDTLAPERARRALAVEPMTCPPNAFNGGAAAWLQPGEQHRNRWGIEAAHR